MSRLPIGIFTASLRGAVDERIATAGRLGFAGVQVAAGSGEDAWDPEQFAMEARRCLRDRFATGGFFLPALCATVPGHGFVRREGLPERIARTLSIIDFAADLGVPVVSAHIGVVPADHAHPAHRLAAEALVAIGDRARAKGVRYAIETGPEPAATLRALLDRLGHPGLGVNLDPANLAMVHGEDGAAVTAALAPWTVHVHAKDGRRFQACDPEAVYAAFADGGFPALVARTGALFEEVPLGEGQVGWQGVIRELRRAGYRGWLTIEREVGSDPEGDAVRGLRFLTHIQEG